MARLTSSELNRAFVAALGSHVAHVDDLDAAVLTLELAPPLPRRLRAYIFNATNPPGGRPTPEHKVQLMVPGQSKGGRGNFDFSEDRSVVLAGKVEDQDIFVLWDALLHRDFGAYANVQVQTKFIQETQATRVITTQVRPVRLGEETVIVAPTTLLADAIARRFHDSTATSAPSSAAPAPAHELGTAYAPPPRTAQATEPKSRVFEVDPDKLDRGTTAHKDVQDALAEAVRNHGLEPRSPGQGEVPQFDVAWMRDGVAYVAEVKSLTDDNEDRQLRLGLGQVLSYAHLLSSPGAPAVRAVLAVERPPTADYWTTLCAEHDVILTWPEAYNDLFAENP